MGFEKFGNVSFTSQTKASAFVDFLEEGKLCATRCKNCKAEYFPPRADCSACLSSDMEWFEIKGEGELITYTKSIYAPAGFEKDLPYSLALVSFGDLKIFGRLSKSLKDEEIKIGMKLKANILKLPGDRITYEFVAA
ncbi:MAG: DNA-binding protein [Spirochaetes bacterium]|nr:Zn-ribbon domain-containing OB-fold protein [Deltaproteobacteria bacterium]RKY01174.1 MAG: DNA-binding protein [Spirochaetota bacterium]RLA90735.1 MAG: DNA-binding protein [Deltaproteobacteria bacterium]